MFSPFSFIGASDNNPYYYNSWAYYSIVDSGSYTSGSSTLVDLSPNQSDATIVNAVGLEYGVSGSIPFVKKSVGNSYATNAAHIEGGDYSITGLTHHIWIKPVLDSSPYETKTPFQIRWNASGNFWGVTLQQNGPIGGPPDDWTYQVKLVSNPTDSTSQSELVTLSPTGFVDNYHLFSYVWDSGNTITMYYDGVQVKTAPTTKSWSGYATVGDSGCNLFSTAGQITGEQFEGNWGSMAFYRQKWNSNQILDYFNATKGDFGIFPTDPDAQAFIDATGISGTEATAINTLVVDLKADNLWDKMKVIYPMVGGTFNTMKYNLVDPQDTDAAYRIDWVGSSTTFNSDGVTFPQLTSDYGKTYINLSGSTDFDPTQGHISIYNRGYSLPPANSYLIGFRDSSVPNFNNTIFLNTISGSISNWNGGTALVGTLSGVTGLIMANRVVTTAIENWRNGVLEINNTSAPWFNRATDIQMTIGAQNRINTDTSPGTISTIFPTSANVAFVSVGDGLDNTEAANLYTAVQTFQTTLSRQV